MDGPSVDLLKLGQSGLKKCIYKIDRKVETKR